MDQPLPDKFTTSGLTFDDVLIVPRYSAVVPAEVNVQSTSLTKFMDENGEKLLVGELIVLAVCTVGAISTDGYWARRAMQPSADDATSSEEKRS